MLETRSGVLAANGAEWLDGVGLKPYETVKSGDGSSIIDKGVCNLMQTTSKDEDALYC